MPTEKTKKTVHACVIDGLVLAFVVLALFTAFRGCYHACRWLGAKADQEEARARHYEEEVRR